MSQLDKIVKTFANRGYKEKTLITQQTFFTLLNSIRAIEFDVDIAQQIWDQAYLNARQQATILNLCEVIDEAQFVLMGKIIKIQSEIFNQQQNIKILENSEGNRGEIESDVRRIIRQMEDSKKAKTELQQDLILITEPFGININLVKENYQLRQTRYDQNRRGRVGVSQQNTDLQYLFYIILTMSLIQAIIIYKKYDFLNLLVIVTVSSIFLLDYFDNTYIKVCGTLASISSVVDFVWLIMYGGTYWNPQKFSEHNQMQYGYLKLIFLLTIVNILIKIYLVYLIMKQNVSETGADFTINPFEGITLNVSTNNDNIVTKTFQSGSQNVYL